ncbi:hypothetical protein ONZ43_g7084 [Nemania bipapillata]|uniref:Uncharacterized protein n=1 Tax=Nemania bipapillata TaxID=110536 RepID=A0ACC2HTH1_9PEZI|nr:hypothetical protein ONZ43_g7084 [Nemania bipapillata]
MVTSLRGPRRLFLVTFLVTSLFLILALRHREFILGPSAPAELETFAPDSGETTPSGPLAPQGPEPEPEPETHEVEPQPDVELELVVASVKAENTSRRRLGGADGAEEQGPRGHGVPDVPN